MKTRRVIQLVLGMRSERGAAIVEFALVVPFLMLMMCATIDFGLAVYTLNNLTAAAREGGRYGATLDFSATGATTDAQNVRDRVFRYIVNLNSAGLDSTQVKALITVTMPVNPATRAIANGGNVTVQITGFPYKPVTPLAKAFGMSTITLNRLAIFRWERSG